MYICTRRTSTVPSSSTPSSVVLVSLGRAEPCLPVLSRLSVSCLHASKNGQDGRTDDKDWPLQGLEGLEAPGRLEDQGSKDSTLDSPTQTRLSACRANICATAYLPYTWGAPYDTPSRLRVHNLELGSICPMLAGSRRPLHKDRNELPFTFYQKVNVGPDISTIWVRYWNIRFIYTITSSSDQYKACGLPVSATSAATLNC